MEIQVNLKSIGKVLLILLLVAGLLGAAVLAASEFNRPRMLRLLSTE